MSFLLSTFSPLFAIDVKLKYSLVTLDLENADFIEAFDAYTSDLNITDASDEAQCEQVREFLGFEPDYIDDYEICREFYDIKCDYENGNADFEEKKGGTIPDFKGFEFKPASFDGFVFSDSGFVGFEFEGFEPSPDLTFQAVGELEMSDPNICRYRCWE